ncbi:MAG: hypothetical protein ACYSUY_04060 [Planctomycetota bacterium]|jgi:hypothetical protein
MDIPQFKDVIQKLSVFKRHSSLFVPVVIGFVGVLLFVPAQFMSSKLKAQISDESITKRGRQVASLQQQAVARTQWSVQRKRQNAYKSDANQISLLAKELTQRQLLSDKIFPEPKDTSILLFKEFGQRFRSGVDEQLRGVNAGECPTKAELDRSVGGLTSSGRRIGSRLRRGALSGAGGEIRDALCRSKAESASVYINPFTLSGYVFWADYQYAGTPEAVKDCWYHQLGYWIIEDIIDTVGTMNSGSNSVFESPVKRFMGVGFDTGEKGLYTRKKKAVGQPSYVLTIEDGLVFPWTSRVCNNDIDVVHFSVRVVVSTKAVMRFMQQLSGAKQHIIRESNGQIQDPRYAKHNQITILESEIKSIDRRDKIHDFYRYGEDAVVELDLFCEYVFSRKGYDDIKPESVKQSLIIPTVPMGWDSRRDR